MQAPYFDHLKAVQFQSNSATTKASESMLRIRIGKAVQWVDVVWLRTTSKRERELFWILLLLKG